MIKDGRLDHRFVGHLLWTLAFQSRVKLSSQGFEIWTDMMLLWLVLNTTTAWEQAKGEKVDLDKTNQEVVNNTDVASSSQAIDVFRKRQTFPDELDERKRIKDNLRVQS